MPPARVVVAALFVEKDGAYFGLPDVDPWDVERDARAYAGPHPVVAHPPCERWGRFWHGSPGRPHQHEKGADGGCFASALAAVETWGGVLEHPADSHAWEHFGIARPPREGGWVPARRGWTCCVEQGQYGHRARKRTWLYAVASRRPPDLAWGPADIDLSLPARTVESTRARGGRLSRVGIVAVMSRRQRAATPSRFRDLLLSIARSAARPQMRLFG